MTTAAIEVDGLVKRYRGADRNAVDGISFSVDRGAFFTLLGPNGAGKTTTLNILTTILAPTTGTARVAGHDVRSAQSEVRRRVGIIFQTPSLDQNITGEENIRLHVVLFLDEPTAGLDVASRRSLWQYLRDVRERSGTTLLLTTHYLEEAEDAD